MQIRDIDLDIITHSGLDFPSISDELSEIYRRVGKNKEDILHALARIVETSGSFNDIFSVPYSVLRDHLGEKGALLTRLLIAIMGRRVRDSIKPEDIKDDQAVARAFVASMLDYTHEVAFVMSIDREGRVIGLDYVCEGSVNTFSVTPRRIIERALDRSAARVVIGHNHPFGSAKPSDEDMASTRKLAQILNAAGIRLDGHVIVSGLSASMLKIDRNDCDSITVLNFESMKGI